MADYISREAALSFPFANGQYDHENANEHFIYGCETYKEWLEQIPAADVRPVVRGEDIRNTVKNHHCEFKCSICGEEIAEHWGEDFNFCPYCGTPGGAQGRFTTMRTEVRTMTLWDMLDKAMYFQKVWIFETNAYDQNMPIYKGNVQGAREEGDLVWDYLPCEVENYACSDGILDIRVRNKYYDERMEGHYSISAESWGKSKEQRPWRHSIEIEQEKKEETK